MKEKIIKLIAEGKVLYDVCNDYSLVKSNRLEKECWSNYRLTENGILVHKKHDEIHYQLK